jgi:hypothetical protein
MAGRARKREDVGEVELSRRVVGPDLRKGRRQHSRVEGVDARVDLGDATLLRCGVLVLDNRLDCSCFVAHHPAVASGIGDFSGQDRDCVDTALVLCKQPAQRRRCEQWSVAVRHDDSAGERGQLLERTAHRVRGTSRSWLDGHPQRERQVAQVLLDRRAVRPYHHQEVLGFERCGCVHRVSDKASSADLMQDLGLRGLHPGARPCRQDDERRRTVSPHAPAP